MAVSSLIGGVGRPLLYVLWLQVLIAVVLVSLRFYAASRTKNNKWRWDFIWIAVSLLAAFLACLFASIAVSHGLGQHFALLPLAEALLVLRWNYYAIYMGALSIAFSKFSVTALLLDVQKGAGKKVGRYVLWAVAILFSITTLLEIFLTAFQCTPVNKVWNVLEAGSCPAQKEARAISYVHAIFGGLSDIFLALFPISIVWNLQTSLKVKVGFCALMAIGMLPAFASFVRFHLLHKIYDVTDFTYEEGLFMIWAAIETGTLIIIGSIPPLRPLFMRVFFGKQKSKTTYATSRLATRNQSMAAFAGPEGPNTETRVVLEGKDVEQKVEDEQILVSHSFKIEEGTHSEV
ncbi:hypothetical protein ANO11243_084460 [Dothideomycetidae sp. 11243]|nr:hypothetical protein ANO11243_084460 [fungal sp. No.11243]